MGQNLFCCTVALQIIDYAKADCAAASIYTLQTPPPLEWLRSLTDQRASKEIQIDIIIPSLCRPSNAECTSLPELTPWTPDARCLWNLDDVGDADPR